MRFSLGQYVSLVLIVAGIGRMSIAAPTRVALLGTGNDSRLEKIRDLTEAGLPNDAEIQLLERQNVQRLLAEQRLSLSGLVTADTAVKAGKILSADLLAVVESEPGAHAAALVIFDPATGVRLWDSALVMDDGAKAAENIVHDVRDAAAKRLKFAGIRTICLMTVRNADLPRDMDGFCDAVGRLLERSLVRSSSVALLERTRLEQVERECAISPDASRHDLLASLVIVELEIDRGTDGNALRAVAILTDGAGKTIGKLSVSGKKLDAAALAAAIADAFNSQFKITPGGQMDRAVEAARFYYEAQLRGNGSDYLHAAAMAEAASALMPDDLVYRAMLARCLADSGIPPYGAGHWIQSGPVPPALVRGAAMLADIFPLTKDKTARGHLAQGADRLRTYLMWAEYDRLKGKDKTGAAPPDIAAVMESFRRYLIADDAETVAAITDSESLRRYTANLERLIVHDDWLSSSPAEWSQDYQRVAEQWLDLRAKYPVLNGSAWNVLKVIAFGWQANMQTYQEQLERPIKLWRKTGPADYARLAAVSERMRRDPDFTVRSYAELLGLAMAVTKADGNADEMKRCVDQYIETKKTELGKPEFKDRPDLRGLLYELMGCAGELLDYTPYRGKSGIELLDFALAQKELPSLVVYNGVNGRFVATGYSIPRAELTRRIDAIERVLKLGDLPGVRWLPTDFADEYRRELLIYKRDVGDVKPAAVSWSKSRKLIDVFDDGNGQKWITKPIVSGDVIYAMEATAAHSLGDISAQLVRIPIDGGAIERLGGLTTHVRAFRPPAKVRSQVSFPLFRATCLADGRYCGATWGEGILIFPTDGSPAERLDAASGLPSSSGQAVALLDGKIYAGLGYEGKESYIASYDLTTKRVDVLASNSRKEKRSPFDDGTVFRIANLTADVPRHRLIVMVQRYEPATQVNGIWEYKPDTGKWRQLQPMRLMFNEDDRVNHGLRSAIEWVGKLRNGKIPVATNFGVFWFDLETDRAVMAFQRKSATHEMPLPATSPILPIAAPAAQAKALELWPNLFLSAYVEPWLYMGAGTGSWGRINLATAQVDRFDSPRNDGSLFQPACLEPLGDGRRMLVGDDYGLWILTFPSPP